MTMPVCQNRVQFLLAVLISAAIFLPFVNYAPNRLVSGESLSLWQITAFSAFWLPVLPLLFVGLSFLPGRGAIIVSFLLAQTFFTALVWGAGETANYLANTGSPLARTSPGSGLWLWMVLALLICGDTLRRLKLSAVWRWILHVQLWMLPVLLLWGGQLNDLSLLKEYANRQEVFDDALLQYLILLFGTLLPGLLIGIPFGLWCWRHPARQTKVFALLNVIQTIPSVALFGLLIAPLAGLARQFPWLASLGVAGTGLTPALIALVLYALLPLVRGVVAGMQQVPQEVLESAQAIGLGRAQRFWQVQLPLALPVLLRSLRVVAIQTIGMAVVAALIGAGGFGALVFQGLLSSALDLVLLGVIPVVALAVITDALFSLGIALLKGERGD